ncbi:APC family permease [Corynebacterium felinum]|uniref:Amino acid transporter n=1 Tax=Corynebacterium felinum TaxID=131318 RepID=A0ABU2B577_9CORY|nr:APC family permease [Corynebacterium felinum]MDF5820621.1 APC family permease [Corynebacterium felinum]MDR7353556.1 amino acid transporter [Corynebacterium felinum]WJY95737.1 Putrescine importer PuuP [Corynebacterium felinum]
MSDKLQAKGLSAGSVGLISAAVIGLSCIAPAYTLSGGLGPTASAVGVHMPAIFLVSFIPMLLVALGYKELNQAMPDSGTTFTWATRAFGPVMGWLGGWGLLAATILVLSNLAGIAVDFFYLLLSQLFNKPELAELTRNVPVNIATCLVFIVVATTIAYRGMDTTKAVQYVLVSFQLAVLVLFAVMALWRTSKGEAFDATPISLEWFNPFGIDSFSAFAAGVSLSVFIYWGWDVVLTMTEETKGSHATPGKAATLTILVIVFIYQLIAVSLVNFAGTSSGEFGLGNEAIQENIFAALAGPVMGPLAILMSIAVLGSSAASLQSTVIGPARTMLAMGFYGALPKRFAHISPRFQSPGFATVLAATVSFVFYAIMRMISEAVLWDTITALGMMVCFYYGITAFSCVWYFRKHAFDSLSHAFNRFFAPLIGGTLLLVFFFQTSIDAMDPSYGSGSQVFGVGLVFVLGSVVLLLGVVMMGITWWRCPEFFRNETLTKGTPNDPLITVDSTLQLD